MILSVRYQRFTKTVQALLLPFIRQNGINSASIERHSTLSNWKTKHSPHAYSQQMDPHANLTHFLSKLDYFRGQKKNQVYIKLYIEINVEVTSFKLKYVDKRITLPN